MILCEVYIYPVVFFFFLLFFVWFVADAIGYNNIIIINYSYSNLLSLLIILLKSATRIMCVSIIIIESVDSISRDGPDTPIYIIHYKKRNNSEQENFKRF